MHDQTGMELRKRIAIAFVFTILLSVALCAVVFNFLVQYNLRSIGREYGIADPRYENLYNNTLLISSRMDEDIRRLQEIVREDPSVLEDAERLDSLNTELNNSVSFLIVTKGSSVVYNGRASLSYGRLSQVLELFDTTGPEGIQAGQTEDGALVRQFPVRFPDEAEGSLFLVSTLDRVAPEIRLWLLQVIFVIILILTVMSVLMGQWIFRGVEAPIKELQTATQNIRDGDLDQSIRRSGVKELDDLCRDFEEMRVRLKDSAESKMENERQSRELVSNISHDLKTPITTIRGYVEGILDGVADTPEKMDHYLRTIRNKVNEIDQLINELTVYSRLDTNRIPYNYVKLDVTDYFTDCAEELSLELEEQGIDFSFVNYLKEDAVIIADPEQLRRVISNIVANSLKYADKEKTEIRLRLRDIGDLIQVELEDNGRGIAQKDLPRIFDRFYRSDAARTSQGGSGIGLSVVKKIVEDHEGKVWAASKEGEGTVIYFVLRKYKEPEQLQQPETRPRNFRTEMNSVRQRLSRIGGARKDEKDTDHRG